MSLSNPAGTVFDQLLEDNRGRDPKRLRLKFKLMGQSSFAFFRGACAVFARDWSRLSPPRPGPPILVCGDLHLENFGAFRDDERAFHFDINDFDEALVAPCAIDPVRCATSILLAANLWKLSALEANGLVLAYLDEYRAAVTSRPQARLEDVDAPRLESGPIGLILGKTALGTQSQLLDLHTERLKNGTRRIVRDKRKHPELDADVAEKVFSAVADYGRAKGESEAYRPLDATGRIAGVGSLGLRRYLVLVAGDGSSKSNRLLDIKEEGPSAWLPYAGTAALPSGSSEAARVVYAQRTLQANPTAGLDVIPIEGIDFRIREMIPAENRSSLDRFHQKPGKLRQAIIEAGRLTGLAHLRGAHALESGNVRTALAKWAAGAALDSILAAAARYAERTRVFYKEFVAETRETA